MPYVREWETAIEALQRLTACGQTEAQAMRDICDAIADRAIPIRVHCADGSVYTGTDVMVPARLDPADLCWESSHPLRRWERRPRVVDRYFDEDLRIEVELLELRRDAVTRVLLRGETASGKSDTGAAQMENAHQVAELSEGNSSLGGNVSKGVPRSDDLKPKPTDQAVRQWVRYRVESWPADRTAPSEQTDWEAARNHFGAGLTRDEFRMVRKDETPEYWRTQGRRKPHP
jgi:hypothetical protein